MLTSCESNLLYRLGRADATQKRMRFGSDADPSSSAPWRSLSSRLADLALNLGQAPGGAEGAPRT